MRRQNFIFTYILRDLSYGSDSKIDFLDFIGDFMGDSSALGLFKPYFAESIGDLALIIAINDQNVSYSSWLWMR